MRWTLVGAILVLLLLPFHSEGQEAPDIPDAPSTAEKPCQPRASFLECLLLEQARTLIADKTSLTGDAGGMPSLNDLISSFLGAVGIEAAEDPTGNLKVQQSFTAGFWRVGFTGVLNQPTLFSDLDKKLDEADLEDLRKDLSDDVDGQLSFDGTLRASFERVINPGARTFHVFGREPDQYADVIELYATADPGEKQRRGVARERREAGQALRALPDIRKTLEGVHDGLTADQQRALIEAAQPLAETVVEPIAELIANQPQLVIEGGYAERQGLTGINQTFGRLKYEIGLMGNLNDFVRWGKKRVEDAEKREARAKSGKKPKKPVDPEEDKEAEAAEDACVSTSWHLVRIGRSTVEIPPPACLEAYLGSDKKRNFKSGLEPGDSGKRLAVSAEWSEADAFSYTPADATEPLLDIKESEVWTGSVSFGRYIGRVPLLGLLGAGEDRTRVEVTGNYQWVSDDPSRQQRWVWNLGLSQELTDRSTVTVTLVYADKPEFRGAVDHEVSARFGISWKRDKPKKTAEEPES